MITLSNYTTHMAKCSNCTSVTGGLGLSLILSQNFVKRKYFHGCLHISSRNTKFPRSYRNIFFSVKRYSSENCLRTPAKLKSHVLRAVFFGSDDFSLESLKALNNELKGGLLTRLDVVSSIKTKINPVQKFANEQGLTLHNWPPQFMDGEFDVGLVVSFGNLIPQHIINYFPLGILNVHASLLPRWRGAAPIIYSILNGDEETGVTVMLIKPKRFDIGDIVSQASCQISPNETRIQLSERLARMGSQLLLETIRDLPHCLEAARPQPSEGVTYAPRVTLKLARVNWCEMDSHAVFNLSRALAELYPVSTSWHSLPVKLFHAAGCTSLLEDSVTTTSHSKTVESFEQVSAKQVAPVLKPGFVEFHRPSQELRVLCRDKCWVHFKSIGLAGKKPMKPIDFYNGYISRHTLIERTFT